MGLHGSLHRPGPNDAAFSIMGQIILTGDQRKQL